jgi:predicted glycosyl hydrolase (DUF1957 family)
MKTGTAREYATKRTLDHLARFNRYVINSWQTMSIKNSWANVNAAITFSQT